VAEGDPHPVPPPRKGAGVLTYPLAMLLITPMAKGA